MSENLDFYKWFNSISPKLGQREISFKKIFKYLDSLPSPIIIVETGCLRKKDNFLNGHIHLRYSCQDSRLHIHQILKIYPSWSVFPNQSCRHQFHYPVSFESNFS